MGFTGPQLNGLDWAVPWGVPILAPIAGECRIYWDEHGYGENVEIYFEGGYSILAHGVRGSTRVRNGQFVLAGTHLFDCDSTGFSTGPHPHLGLKLYGQGTDGYRDWVDPMPFIVESLTEEPVEMNAPRLRIGMHAFYPETASYRRGIPAVELAYAFEPTAGLDIETRAQFCTEIRSLGHRPMLRIDYKPGQTCPIDEAELSAFLNRINDLFAAYPSLNGIDITAFNEPNLDAEGSFAAGWVARCFNGFGTPDIPENNFVGRVKSRQRGPDCKIWVPAGLAFGSHVDGGRGAPPGGENSIWSRWYFDLLFSIGEAADMSWARQPYGFLLHSYARVEAVPDDYGKGREPWFDVRSADGARFGTNIVDTWQECLDAVDYGDHPVWISEYNSGAGSRPDLNYPNGLLLHARDRMIATFGERAEALIWFVGRHDGVWNDRSLQDPQGAMVRARSDFLALNDLGA